MMQKFQLDVRMCSTTTIRHLGLDITAANNEHCLQNNVTFAGTYSTSKLSNPFKCQKPLVTIGDLKLLNMEGECICIDGVGLETREKKFMREGLNMVLNPDEWSSAIRTNEFGESSVHRQKPLTN